jgi:hypothetical protein
MSDHLFMLYALTKFNKYEYVDSKPLLKRYATLAININF